MKDKRVYLITKMQLKNMGEPVGDYYTPWFAGLDTEIDQGHTPGSDDDHWDVVYSEDSTNGIPNSAIVGIYTTEANHATLEADPDIERIDNI